MSYRRLDITKARMHYGDTVRYLYRCGRIVCAGCAKQFGPSAVSESDARLFDFRLSAAGIQFLQLPDKPPQLVDGKYTRIHYYLKDPQQNPGGLAIRRNYENAIKAISGEVVYSDDNVSVMKAMRDGVEVWTEVHASTKVPGRIYFLHIVERTPMAQVITADAMAAAIDKDGFIALDVHFATGKADILPESRPLIDEVVKMLSKRSTLRVGIEGHTDNTGTAADQQDVVRSTRPFGRKCDCGRWSQSEPARSGRSRPGAAGRRQSNRGGPRQKPPCGDRETMKTPCEISFALRQRPIATRYEPLLVVTCLCTCSLERLRVASTWRIRGVKGAGHCRGSRVRKDDGGS